MNAVKLSALVSLIQSTPGWLCRTERLYSIIQLTTADPLTPCNKEAYATITNDYPPQYPMEAYV